MRWAALGQLRWALHDGQGGMSQSCELSTAWEHYPKLLPAQPGRPWPSAGLSRAALMLLMRQGRLQKNSRPENIWRKNAFLLFCCFFFLNSLGCPAASGVTPRRELCTRWAWLGSAQQSRAPWSPAEPSQACYLPRSTPYLREQL